MMLNALQLKKRCFKRYFSVLLIFFFVFSAFSCGKIRKSGRFILRTEKARPLPNNASIGVYVEPGYASRNLGDHMVSALLNQGFNVREVDIQQIIPGAIRYDLVTGSGKTAYEEMVNQMKQGGKLNLSDKQFAYLLAMNSVKIGKQRVKDWSEIAAEFAKQNKADYLMYIYPNSSPYEYFIRVMKIESREIVFHYFIKADALGFYQKIDRPKVGDDLSISKPKRKDRTADEIIFCEHIAKQLK